MREGLFSLSEFPEKKRAVLRLHVDYLSLNETDAFRDACLSLLQTGQPHLVVDLRYLHRIPSSALGAVIDLGLLCRKGAGAEGGGVTVLAREDIAEHFRRFTHSEVLDVQTFDPDSKSRTRKKSKKKKHDTAAMAGD